MAWLLSYIDTPGINETEKTQKKKTQKVASPLDMGPGNQSGEGCRLSGGRGAGL